MREKEMEREREIERAVKEEEGLSRVSGGEVQGWPTGQETVKICITIADRNNYARSERKWKGWRRCECRCKERWKTRRRVDGETASRKYD